MVARLPRLSNFIHIKSRRDVPHLIMVIFLILGIALGVYLALQPQIFNKQAQEGSIVDMVFIPEVIQTETGRDYEVKIGINPKGERVTAVKLNISYDPQSVSITEARNAGFLPVDLKVEDSFTGNLTLIYGSTIETQSDKPGMLSTIKFKVINPYNSELQIKTDSEVSISSQEGNALTSFPLLKIEPVITGAYPGEEPRYPDNLLLEKAFFPDSSPILRDFKESLEPKPLIKPLRIKPELSIDYVKQLGTDIFITPIQALNQVLQESVGGAVGKD